MANFIVVHKTMGGQQILVNVDKIISIEPGKSGGTYIYVHKEKDSNGLISVIEGYEVLKRGLLGS